MFTSSGPIRFNKPGTITIITLRAKLHCFEQGWTTALFESTAIWPEQGEARGGVLVGCWAARGGSWSGAVVRATGGVETLGL